MGREVDVVMKRSTKNGDGPAPFQTMVVGT